ncbi:energy transducer TonB [Asticcacaulis sp. YBE204]|uniref:TonB family protein n=1 Tax=Asticcacaulis sp. YBE204 TaxID=1282363 RepID=UPI0003C3E626|nr:energy transducer TonB [Asticcacaulis sp. YBE204]ESQ79626.1 hypothetical protein AEYBE204_07225 [Asticcacaulis sp. YBE204]
MLTFKHKLFATGASVVLNGGFLLALAFWSPTVTTATSDVVMEVSMEPLDLSAEIARDSAAPPPSAESPPPPVSEPLPKPKPVSDTKTPEKAPEKPAEKPADVRAEAPSNTAAKSPATITLAAPGNGRVQSDAPLAPTSGPTPAAQSAVKIGKHRASYLALVRRHLESFKVYPKQAKRRRVEGTITLSFTIDRQGRVLSSHITKGSGSAELDQAALDMLTAAQPLPKPPADVTGDRIDLNVMTEFSLEN